jgi:hypothetical protein
MPDDRKAILLRLPPELWQDLNVWAKDELRSLNAQIEYLLRDAAQRRKRQAPSNTKNEQQRKR